MKYWYNVDEPQKYATWKKPDTKCHKFYDSIWNIQKGQIHKDRRQICGYQGLGLENGKNCLMVRGFTLESWKCVELDRSGGSTTFWMY